MLQCITLAPQQRGVQRYSLRSTNVLLCLHLLGGRWACLYRLRQSMTQWSCKGFIVQFFRSFYLFLSFSISVVLLIKPSCSTLLAPFSLFRNYGHVSSEPTLHQSVYTCHGEETPTLLCHFLIFSSFPHSYLSLLPSILSITSLSMCRDCNSRHRVAVWTHPPRWTHSRMTVSNEPRCRP